MPRPQAEALRAQNAEARAATIAGRYVETMRSLGMVEKLVERAIEGEAGTLDGETLIKAALARDTSDLPGIRERGYLRFAVAPDPLTIAFDGERAIGVAVEVARELEQYLHKQGGSEGTPTVVVPMPIPLEEIPARLQEGVSDFTALMTTEKHQENLDFTDALLTDVRDVVMLGEGVEGVETIDDLTDVTLYVEEGGHHSDNLKRLNKLRVAEGKEPLPVYYVDPRLADYDLVEMVQVGVIPATVMADFKAEFWNQIYTGVEVREDLALSAPVDIAWAVRTENPELREALDGFAQTIKKGTLIGNVLLKRYFGSANWIQNVGDPTARTFFDEVEPVIRRYSEQFQFESDLVLAQAYQESQLDQTRRSHVGAIGVMQVMPATAADPVVGIPDVSSVESNVHAGIKYLRWLRDTYFSEPEIEPLDRTLLSFAAYNAGPGGVQRARKRAVEMGLDPNVWFENVEVAITKAVSREPAIYVRNIFKYYVSYRLLKDLELEREELRGQVAEVSAAVGQLPPEQQLQVLEEARIVTGREPGSGEMQVGMGIDDIRYGPVAGVREQQTDEAGNGTGANPREATAPATDGPDEEQARVDDGLRAR